MRHYHQEERESDGAVHGGYENSQIAESIWTPRCRNTRPYCHPSDTTTAIRAQAITQCKSWRSDGSPSCLGGSKPTVHPCPPRWGGGGLPTNSTQVSRFNEPKCQEGAYFAPTLTNCGQATGPFLRKSPIRFKYTLITEKIPSGGKAKRLFHSPDLKFHGRRCPQEVFFLW